MFVTIIVVGILLLGGVQAQQQLNSQDEEKQSCSMLANQITAY